MIETSSNQVKYVLIGLVALSIAEGIQIELNPGCSVNCQQPWLIKGIQRVKDLDVHHIWSAVSSPSVMVATTEPNSTLSIDWNQYQKGAGNSLKFSSTPKNVFGFSIQNLILYDDISDKGAMTNDAGQKKIFLPTSKFEWQYVHVNNSQAFMLTATKFDGKRLPNNTDISFKITATGVAGRDSMWPCLYSTPYSAQLNSILQNIFIDINNNQSTLSNKPTANFTHPRWALDIMMFSTDMIQENSKYEYVTKKLWNDENSPGVFSMNAIITPSINETTVTGGYMQWRPIAYLKKQNKVYLYSTLPNFNTNLTQMDSNHFNATKKSLPYAMYGDSLKDLLTSQTTVSFGKPKDGFYTAYNYTDWTMSYGLGVPPVESASLVLTISLILINVALPGCALCFFIKYLIDAARVKWGVRRHESLRDESTEREHKKD